MVNAASVLKASSVRNTIPCAETSRVAVSPGGVLIAASSGLEIVVFDIHTGERIGDTLRGHESTIRGLQFSADGARLASCSWDRTIRLWDVKTRKTVGEPLWGHTSAVLSLAWSRDGQRLVSTSDDGTVRVWDTFSGRQIWRNDIPHAISSVAYSPDGACVMSAGRSNEIAMWRSDDGRPAGVLSGRTSWVTSVAFSPDGTQIASGSIDGTIRICDVQTGEQVGVAFEGHTSWVYAVVFSPDGACIASISHDQTLRLWNLGATGLISGRVIGRINSQSLAFSPDGAYLVTAAEASVIVWDTDYSTVEDTPAHHTKWVTCLALSPTGAQVVSGFDDQTIRIWDSITGKPVGQPLVGHTGWVTAVAVSPDGASIVSGSEQTLYLWDMTTSRQVGDPLEGHKHTIRAVSFSGDGRRILSCSDSELLIWDMDSCTVLSRGRFDKYVTLDHSLSAFVPNRSLLVRASQPNQVLLWDVALQKPRCPPWSGEEYPTSIALSSDGAQIVLGHINGKVSIWDLSGRLLNLFEGHRRWVRAVAFSPNGTHVASGSDDETIRITNVKTGMALGRPIQCGDKVISLAFSADGMRLASGLWEGLVRIWDVSPQSLVSGKYRLQ